MMKRVYCSVAFVSVSLLFSCRIDVVDRNAPFDFIARYDEIGFAESPLRRPPIEGVAWRGATGVAAQSTASMLDQFENDEIHIAANPDLKKLEIRLDLRDAIFAPVPTRIEADLVLGNDPYLSFGYGVDPSNWDVPGEAFFEASIRTEAGERRLFSKALDPQRRRRHRRWFDDQLSLRDYGGERVTISLQTRAVGPQNRSTSWSTPRVIYPRKKGEKNVILISLDTLRADHLNCYGYTARETSPNIDEFARDGTRFATVISSSPWTTPSHMSILTSLYPSYHGVNGPFGNTMRRLNMKVPTIAERLRAAGYVTAAFTGRGSISARYGFSKGFDRYYETERIRANDLDRIYEKTSAWLEANSQFKFFLFFHTYEVHRPNTHDVFEEAQTSPSRKVRDVAGYDSDLRYTDAYIDRLMEKLKSLGIYDESIIILLSDHGENLHDRMVEIQPIGHGYHVYDELLKVPLIFVMPGEVLGGQVVERQVSLVDVMPTILDLLSIENPDFMQGESLAPYLIASAIVRELCRTRAWLSRKLLPLARRELLCEAKASSTFSFQTSPTTRTGRWVIGTGAS